MELEVSLNAAPRAAYRAFMSPNWFLSTDEPSNERFWQILSAF
jgi:hypothetical protein